MTRRADGYTDLLRVVSALLYAYDPDGMGLSASAPEDEYDDVAQTLIAEAIKADGAEAVATVVRAHYASASDVLCEAVSAAIALYMGRRTS